MTRRADRFRTNSLRDLQQRRVNRRSAEPIIRSVESELVERAESVVEDSLPQGRLDYNQILSTSPWGMNTEQMARQLIEQQREERERVEERERSSLNNMTFESLSFSLNGTQIADFGVGSLQVNRDTEINYIKSYNYVPSKFNFNKTVGEDENTLYLGVELEIDKGGRSNDTAKFIQEFLGEENCYVMHDGSLDDGLEITTHPCTLNYHRELPYRELFSELVGRGYKSHDTRTCGYHIHVNRNFFGEDPTEQDLCITKILYLIEKYWEDVEIIARRGSNGYSRRFNMKENESLFNLLVKAKDSCTPRYMIVNLQKSKTVEFRMFKGTLKYETFMATMEFVSSLCYLCKEVSLGDIQKVSFEDILHGRYVKVFNVCDIDTCGEEYLIEYYNERLSKKENNRIDRENRELESARRAHVPMPLWC